MAGVILLASLLAILTAVFKIVAMWFQLNRNINIIPAALLNMTAAIIILFNYDGKSTKNMIALYAAIAMILAIIVFNLMKYGLKYGILASMAEIIFAASAAFLIILILIVESENSKNTRSKRKRK